MPSHQRVSDDDPSDPAMSPPSSVQRIDPKDFHSVAAQQYTERCVQQLMESKSYKAFRNHEDYHERFFLTWFLAPLGLLAVFYIHLIVFSEDYVAPFTSCTTTTVPPNTVPILNVATAALLLFVIPWTLLAPFSGFFEDLSGSDSFFVLAFFTAINLALTSFGGAYAHFPPFIVAEPAIPWFSTSASRYECVVTAVVRALPLQGYLVACYWFTRSHRIFWRRAWHLPLPLLTTPVLVGLCGTFTWRVVHLVLPFLLSADLRSVTPLVKASGFSQWRADPSAVANIWKPVAVEVGQTLRTDVVQLFQQGKIPGVMLGDTSGLLCLYLAALSLSAVYFAVLLVRPVAQMVFDGLLFFLPTDPTVWGLTLATCVGALVMMLRMTEVLLLWPASVAAIIFGLLYNGFVA